MVVKGLNKGNSIFELVNTIINTIKVPVEEMI
jgi:hypothetical protein